MAKFFGCTDIICVYSRWEFFRNRSRPASAIVLICIRGVAGLHIIRQALHTAEETNVALWTHCGCWIQMFSGTGRLYLCVNFDMRGSGHCWFFSRIFSGGGLHLTKKNTVLSISVGTVFYMVLVHLIWYRMLYAMVDKAVDKAVDKLTASRFLWRSHHEMRSSVFSNR